MQREIRILIYSANSHAHFDQELKNGEITLSQEMNQCILFFPVSIYTNK